MKVETQILLDDAAKNFSSYTKREPSNKTDGMILNARYLAFKAGAEWQKGQYKELKQSLIDVLNVQISMLQNVGDLDNPIIKKARLLLSQLNK